MSYHDSFTYVIHRSNGYSEELTRARFLVELKRYRSLSRITSAAWLSSKWTQRHTTGFTRCYDFGGLFGNATCLMIRGWNCKN